ncbi:MAG: hypothetical protein WCP77_22135 [Roseococcus sp.]
MIRIFLLLLAIAAPLLPTAQAQPLRFVVFGDMPYCRDTAIAPCAAQVARVEALTQAINAARPAFSIFVGDTKGGSEVCDDAGLLRAANWFAMLDAPLVYTPGDNEWTDCWTARAGRFHPPERLAFLRRQFFASPMSLGRQPMPLGRQSEVMLGQLAFDGDGFVENARWTMAGLRFMTLHVTGSNNNLPEGLRHIPPASALAPAEFAAREAASLAWLEDTAALARSENAAGLVIGLQADLYCFRTEGDGFTALRAALLRVAQEMAPRPVLVLTGDSHYFLDERPERAASNLRRVMVPGDQDIRAVLASYEPGRPDPFRFTLLGGAADPARNRCR